MFYCSSVKCQKEANKGVGKRTQSESRPLDLLLSAFVQKTKEMKMEEESPEIINKAIIKDGYVYLTGDEEAKTPNKSLRLKHESRKFTQIVSPEELKLNKLLFGMEGKNISELVEKLRSILKKEDHKIPAILGA